MGKGPLGRKVFRDLRARFLPDRWRRIHAALQLPIREVCESLVVSLHSSASKSLARDESPSPRVVPVLWKELNPLKVKLQQNSC
jgi:hypothetical protein